MSFLTLSLIFMKIELSFFCFWHILYTSIKNVGRLRNKIVSNKMKFLRHNGINCIET